MSTTVADPLLGRLLDDRYRIRRRLATGGMATVYAAVDTRLDRPVAVKVMHPALAGDEEFVARFRREAKAAARLWSPTVVNVTDQGEDAGSVFLVMELVDGTTLRDVLRRQGPLAPEEAVAVLEPVLEALATAHTAGYVHRDVKPENVLIGYDGRIKVGDFGLARAVDASPLTAATGLLLGTVAYLAPEQVRRGVADARTDVYASGVLLYELLTGRPPFEGDTAISVAYQHLHDRVPAPSAQAPAVPEALDELVLAATEPDPDDRPADAVALLDHLREVADGLPPARGLRPRRPVVEPPTDDTAPAGDTTPAPELTAATDDLAPGLPPAGTGSAPGRGTTVRFARGNDGKLRAVRGEDVYVVAGDPDGNADADHDADHGPDHTADETAARRLLRRAGAPLAVLRGLRPAARAWLALLLVTALTVGGVWLFVGRGVAVPQTARLDLVSAENRLRAAGFTVVRGEGEYSETAPRDTVASTSPAAGSRAGKGSRVVLRPSRGPERYTLLPLRGKSYADAVAALATQKQHPGQVQRAFADDVPADAVISSTPPAGTVLPPDQSIALVVSDGPAPVTAPNVIGTGVADAQRTLEGLGLVVDRHGVYSDTVPSNQVTELQPATGLRRQQHVTLVYSLGPELIEIPSVVGQGRTNAVNTLKARGFRVRVLNVPGFDSFVAREVPSSGTKARRGSLITLVLA